VAGVLPVACVDLAPSSVFGTQNEIYYLIVPPGRQSLPGVSLVNTSTIYIFSSCVICGNMLDSELEIICLGLVRSLLISDFSTLLNYRCRSTELTDGSHPYSSN